LVAFMMAIISWQRMRLSMRERHAATQSSEQSAAEEPIRQCQPDRVFVVRLMAEAERPYRGYELLQALLSAGLRFSETQHIFQRYARANAQGSVLFSVASVQKPGTFDMDRMGGYSCPGLVLFMPVDQAEQPAKNLQSMVMTAKQLLDDLGGQMQTEQGEPFTAEVYESYMAELGVAAAA
jgi:cell division protein ZipA